jgi:hypothetical protein
MAVAAGLAVVATGCVTTTDFFATDGRAAGRPVTRPSVFLDRLPTVPFESVGIVEVHAPIDSTLGAVVAEAERKGGEVGCDFVVDRAIYRVSYGIPGARAIVAQTGAAPVIAAAAVGAHMAAVPVTPAHSPPPGVWEFICGVAEQPPAAPAAAVARPGATAANEAGAHIGVTVDVRTAPSEEAPRLTTLTIVSPVIVLGAGRDGWIPVKLPDGRSGYVMANAINR